MSNRQKAACIVAGLVVAAFTLMALVVYCGTPAPTPYTVFIGR